jgi:hypothetical protein
LLPAADQGHDVPLDILLSIQPFELRIGNSIAVAE